MTSPTPDHWQIQDAKQRFSEMIRAVTSEGPQVITRHGEDVAVVAPPGDRRAHCGNGAGARHDRGHPQRQGL